MDEHERKPLNLQQHRAPNDQPSLWPFPLLVLTVLSISSFYSYPVFHTLAEGFSIFTSLGVFVLAWNTRRYMESDYLLFLGIVSLCSGIIDSFHLMSYQGVALFAGYGNDLPTSLWIASRYLQSALLALASCCLPRSGAPPRQLAAKSALAGCLCITFLLIWANFAGWFPSCFEQGSGPTAFKKGSELVICLLFALAGALLWRRRDSFEPAVLRLLLGSVATALAADLVFTLYHQVFDLLNQAGHLCKVLSQYLIYCAIIKKGLRQPLSLLFHQLHQNQQQLQLLNESLENTVRERTAQLLQDIEERKRVETDLAQQTSLLSGLLNSIPDLVFFKNPHGVYLGCNSEFARFIGREPAEVVGCTDYDLVPREQADFFRANDRIMMEQGEPRHNEEWVSYPDGALVLLDTLKAPLRSAEGATVGMLGVSRDITRMKAHEQEIERLNNLYAALSQVNQTITRVQTREELFAEIPRLLVEHGRFPMVWIGWCDPDSHRVQVVSQHGDHSGYLEDIQVYADDRPEGRGPTGTAIRESRTYVCNDYFVDANTLPWRKSAFRAQWRAAAALPIRLQGVALGALTVYAAEANFFGSREIALLEEAAIDISFALDNIERATALAQGIEELRKLSRAVDQSPVSIVITDVHGYIEFVNPRFCELTGYQPQEVLGRKPSLLKSTLVPQEVYRELWSTIASGRIWKGEFVNRKKDGQLYREHATISPIKGPDGKISHYLATKEDITDQYLLKEQLLQSQKMEAIGQLAGGIAHDFNNILTVIMGYSEILALRPSLSEPDREAVAQIGAAADKAGQLTRGLLAFSRKQLLDPKPVDLNDVVLHVRKFLERIIGEDIKLRWLCQEECLTIRADAGQIEQVLINLATNARDAMPGGGVLTVGTRRTELTDALVASYGCGRPGSFACLSITDTGLGIDKEIGERIFEPFYTTKEAGKGTGLGMSIVHGIVSQHEGYIRFESEAGIGTSFHVYLPLVDQGAANRLGEPIAEPIRGGSETLLVVEDDEGVRTITCNILAQQGYQVIIAEDGEAALARFREHRTRIGLVLMDMIMPNKSGFEAYQEIRLLDARVPVLFISGYTCEYFEAKGQFEAGAELIMKPVRPQDLLRKVRDMLDR
jgi:two-component system, cell cycle sensor histidine kinase and response regulator CckA